MLHLIYLTYICVCVYVCHCLPVEVRGQPTGTTYLSPPCGSGIKLRQSGLAANAFTWYSQNHLASPQYS